MRSITLRGQWPSDQVTPLLDSLAAVQEQVFLASGVILPWIRYESIAAATTPSIEVYIDDRLLDRIEWSPLDLAAPAPTKELAELLQAHAREFVVPILLERYLQQLTGTFPDLVRVVRASFSMDDLVSSIRSRMDSQASIRDMRGVLEAVIRGHEMHGSIRPGAEHLQALDPVAHTLGKFGGERLGYGQSRDGDEQQKQ
jgi:hypothetical protein